MPNEAMSSSFTLSIKCTSRICPAMELFEMTAVFKTKQSRYAATSDRSTFASKHKKQLAHLFLSNLFNHKKCKRAKISVNAEITSINLVQNTVQEPKVLGVGSGLCPSDVDHMTECQVLGLVILTHPCLFKFAYTVFSFISLLQNSYVDRP